MPKQRSEQSSTSRNRLADALTGMGPSGKAIVKAVYRGTKNMNALEKVLELQKLHFLDRKRCHAPRDANQQHLHLRKSTQDTEQR
jgi:hypothetical protein